MKKVLFTLAVALMTMTTLGQEHGWKSSADSLIVNHVFADMVGRGNIYSFPRMLTNTDTVFSIDGEAIIVPFSNCYGYFVDHMPYANWAHSCNYCFVDVSMSHNTIEKEMPPRMDTLISLSICSPSSPNPRPIAADTSFVRNSRPSDTSHNWAVLICANGSERRFWFDLSSVYTVLTNVYGYQEGNIFDNHVNRRVIVTAPNIIRDMYKDGLYSPDLNGNGHNLNADGYGDFFNWTDNEYIAHSRTNIENIFKCFAGDEDCLQNYEYEGLRPLTENDRLFVFITGHGRRNSYGSYFPVDEYNNDTTYVYDTTLARWLRNINCSQMTLLMQNCHSGGFVEKFMEDISNPDCLCKNRIGQSAASESGPSWSECYGVYLRNGRDSSDSFADEFIYYWTSAALGYYPYYRVVGSVVVEGPWTPNNRIVGSGNMNWSDYFGEYNEYHQPHSDFDINPDSDDDEILSFKELIEFADRLDTWSYNGYYRPYGDTLDEDYYPEFPQQRYESTFTEETATIVGYEGQVDGIVNSGLAGQPYRLCGDIWVSPGSELTMRDEVQSPQGVKIYIMPSGKLTLNGATLTNYPEQGSPMWQGVQVWGDTDKHQLIENGQYWQGVLEMKETTIKNAVIGVDVWNPTEDRSSGGIVRARDSHFKNNVAAVSFHHYENQFEHPLHPGVVVTQDNASVFRNCEFVVDNSYIGPDQFEAHVWLFGVRGVGFHGCDFRLISNPFTKPYTKGIYAYDAGFKLVDVCLSGNLSYPCHSYKKSTFYGFYKAVVSMNDGSVGIRPAIIKNTSFFGNSFGVVAYRAGFTTILGSTFSIGKENDLCAAGIFAEQTPNFIIEQDTFRLVPRYTHENYGIIIKDSRSQNVIYKNYFIGLYCANLSIGRNNTWVIPRATTGVKADILGLEYRCNENIGNFCDFFVKGGSSYYKLGIQKNQGTTDSPANNTFSQSIQFQFENRGNYGINYHYDPSFVNGTPTNTTSVTLAQTVDTIGCPSHYDIGAVSYNDTLTPVLSISQRLQREEDYYEAYSAYTALKTVYGGMIDGGNTESEIDDIRLATSSDMWTLRAQLLGHSPYLSEKVLVSMLERDDVFPQSVFFEILASNPDELKNDSLIGYLQRMYNPMPDYMINLLRQIAGGVTSRTAMEAQLARYSQEYRLAASDIIRSILCDTIIEKASLIGWLGNMEDMESDREIVSLYLEDGKYSDAIELANLFPSFYGLSGDLLAEHNDYMSLLYLYQALDSVGRTTLQLDSTERAMVEHIAEFSNGTPQAMARAIMMGAYGYSYDDCPNIWGIDYTDKGMGNGHSCFTEQEQYNALGFHVDISPNPAKTWTTIEYSLPTEASQASMRIVNSLGMTVSRFDLNVKDNKKVLDLRGLGSGVYLYEIVCGKYSQVGKLVVVK